MTTFTNFTDPYRGAPHTSTLDFDGSSQVAALDDLDFQLLMRTVELVVQAGEYSRPLLQAALRIPSDASRRLTGLLEQVGVISPGTLDEQRRVLASLDHLPVLLTRLLITRETVPALSAVA